MRSSSKLVRRRIKNCIVVCSFKQKVMELKAVWKIQLPQQEEVVVEYLENKV